MSSEDFQDPLQNYEPKEFADPIQEALAEETVGSIQHTPYATISPETPVDEAIRKLATAHVACLLVVEDGRLVGVFSDRDALDKVALEYDEVHNRPVSELMTPNPVYVYETDASASALCVMAVNRHRHVPILDLDEKVTGIISPQRVTQFLHDRLVGTA
jgi:CBS domain-containing protein